MVFFKMLTADKKHVCQTMLDLYAMKWMIVGPAVALSVAGLALIQDQIKNKVSYVLFPEETSIQKDSRKSAKWRLLQINILSFFS